MYVRSLRLQNFRSWSSADFEFGPGVSVLVGRNGFGKTNVIEALHYVATLRSHRVSTDAPLIRTTAESATVIATVENSGRELTVELHLTAGRANKALINGSPRRRPRDVLGVLRSVLFSPEDLQLVRGDPAERRRYLDELAAMRSPAAAAAKTDYDRVLRQRTALLKTAASAMRRGGSDAESVISTLDVWDEQLAQFGGQVMGARLDVLRDVEPHVVQAYSTIAPDSRPVRLGYRNSGEDLPEQSGDQPADPMQLGQWLLSELSRVRSKEIDRGVCLVGPHRDDVDLWLGAEPAKGFASHGESWSLALALRLGSVELIRADGAEPVLMLDDVFAELDAARRAALVEHVRDAEQVLITAAVAADIPVELSGNRIAVVMKEIDGQRISEVDSAVTA